MGESGKKPQSLVVATYKGRETGKTGKWETGVNSRYRTPWA